MAGLLAVLTAFTTLICMGTTAFAASETAESYMVSYPRDGDAVQVYDHSTWGHDAKTYMNGWSTGASDMTTIHCSYPVNNMLRHLVLGYSVSELSFFVSFMSLKIDIKANYQSEIVLIS